MGEESPYTGEIGAYETLQAWGSDKCVPLVREITFENAEELTEEGLPFLILFHHPDDKEVRMSLAKKDYYSLFCATIQMTRR